MVDGGGLENHCTRKGTGGSNPSPSDLRPGLASVSWRAVPKVVDTGVILVVPQNVDTPGINDVVSPPLDKYLPGG